ncbi:efflux ABC transporter permease protein [Clostridium sp. CAG:273]|nr:efflux ABC transporter permease protein [Clostridium sp. CAG:273]
MKKAVIKDALREIKKSYKRFISILLMAFLGVGFFAGIRASSPDMLDTIDTYYKNQNVYDIQVLSTLGLTSDDINAISKIENVEHVDGNFETDGQIEVGNKEVIAKVMSLNDFNTPVLIDGSLPSAKNECVVEERFLTVNNKNIGDTIELSIKDMQNDNGEDVPYLYEKELKIVGTVQSPMYISVDRGTSTLGSGKIDYYMYIPKSNVQANSIYTNIYVKVKDANKYTTSSKKYEDCVNSVKTEIEKIKDNREKSRYDSLVNTVTKKVEDAEKELNTQKTDAKSKIADAEKELENGKKQIENAEKTIKSNRIKADKEFNKAYAELINGKNKIADSEKQLESKEKQANEEFDKLEKQKAELNTQLTTLNSGITEVQKNIENINIALKNPNLTSEQKANFEKTKKQLENKLSELNNTKAQLVSAISKIDSGIATGKTEIKSAKNKLQSAKNELKKSENAYYSTKNSTYKQLDNAEEELELSKKELKDGENELEKNKKEFNEKIADAESKLNDARAKIAEIENPKWYVLDRNGNTGYSSFIQDTDSIANIGKVFPVIFFIVAALISLTSMTRMVEEQRTQIGTLKALGYNKLQITSKYVLYASLACIIGSILGMSVGFVLLPKIVWKMYSMMYQIGDIQTSFNFEIGSLGFILIVISILGATIYAVIKELIQTPATLMRPKSPKMGKRVFLEKVTFIWKRLSFSRKVTVRNIFRYKKRFLMTIIGIMGCTALIVTGFGIRDSIRAIMPDQYEKVFNYDLQINLKADLDKKQKQDFINSLTNDDKIEKLSETYMSSISAINENVEENVQIIVPNNNTDFNTLINLTDVKSKNNLSLPEDGVLLTDKAAQLLGVEAGDNITLKDTDENETNVKVTNVVENYVYHYIYMSKSMYENLYGKSFDSNVILTKDFNLDNETEDNFVKDLMNMPEVASVTRISTAMNMMNDTMKSLNYVVVILIVSAGLLAFVVLYNLSNVNISERIRELATIKVLGFYDKEVYLYITRETIILTAIGLVLGLVAGYFLDFFILETCEINMLRFRKFVAPLSFVFAALITILFTIIVNIVTYFALKKINMIESLKSVE